MKAQEALDLILPIPAENFIVGQFTNKVDKCCVVGHLTRLTSGQPENYSSENCSDQSFNAPIRVASQAFLTEKHGTSWSNIADVNNDPNINGYTEPVIKDRVVHLLKDMVEAGY